MKILIDELTGEPLVIRKSAPVSAFGGGAALLEPVELEIEIYKSDHGVHTGGTVKTVAELVCSRCLGPFRFPVAAEHSLLYRDAGARSEEENLRLGRNDLDVVFYSEPVINLYDDIRQTIQLALPFKPVCRPGCGGLCPRCGENLNQKKCGCEVIPSSSRFGKLKQLLEKERNSENGKS